MPELSAPKHKRAHAKNPYAEKTADGDLRLKEPHDAEDGGRMRGDARRKQLIETAIRVFSQKGFTGTTTKEIARAANVNEAIIFRHFANKDELYAAILDFKASEVCPTDWLDEMRKVAQQDDDAGLFRLLATKKLEHHRHDKDNEFLRLMFYSALEGHTLATLFIERQVRPIRDFMIAYIKRRQAAGAFQNLHAETVFNTFVGALNHQAMTRAFLPDLSSNIPDKEVVETLVGLVLNGLSGGGKTKKGKSGLTKRNDKKTKNNKK